jgi:hypothetical protein
MNLTAHSRRADPTNGRANRIDLVAERFRLFNSTNVSPIQSSVRVRHDTLSRFRQSLAGTGSRQIRFSLDFEF